MIELHVANERTQLDRSVEADLKTLVAAHEVIVHDSNDVAVGLPAIHESGTWTASADLDEYMADLRRTLAQWRKFQADACYIDDDGSVC